MSGKQNHLLPIILLLTFGVLVGAIIAMVKLAAAAGVSAACFAFVQAAGSGFVILIICLIRGEYPLMNAANLRYYVLAGLSGIALPNQLLFVSVPHLGAGLTSLVYCFPPLATLLLALAMGMEKPNAWRIAGIVTGFVATLLIAVPKDGISADPIWLAIAMLAPLSLAFGNIYRSRAWPLGARPMALAAGMLLAGAAWLAPLTLFSDPLAAMNAPALLILLAVILINAVAYIVFLYLQQIAGPVYLGQVGYINAVSGLVIGVAFLGERYSDWVWMAVAGVFFGVFLASVPTIARARAKSASRN